MCTPALCEAEIALYDINEERLKDSEIILGAINKNVNESRATIKTYLGVENRKSPAGCRLCSQCDPGRRLRSVHHHRL